LFRSEIIKKEVRAMTRPHSRLFHLACKAAKYFFAGLLGVSVTGLIAASFGLFPIFAMLVPWLWSWLLRMGITIGCLFATAVIVESLSS
jgi:CBS domain containing-hemolysin-like protein